MIKQFIDTNPNLTLVSDKRKMQRKRFSVQRSAWYPGAQIQSRIPHIEEPTDIEPNPAKLTSAKNPGKHSESRLHKFFRRTQSRRKSDSRPEQTDSSKEDLVLMNVRGEEEISWSKPGKLPQDQPGSDFSSSEGSASSQYNR